VSARSRRRVMVACVIICAAGTVLNLAAMAAGYGDRWTVVLFCVELSGLMGSVASLRSMRGQR
jgi:hypothetical protein